jgi:hypothetical protein
METRGAVPLHNKAVPRLLLHLGRRLRGLLEPALSLIFL